MRSSALGGILGFALIAAASIAEAGDGRRMLPAHEQKDWSAVGRLNLGDAFCTATLVAEDLIVTAAHCLYASRTGVRRQAERVNFVAGYRMRRHEGHRRGRSLAIHPDYAFARTALAANVSADLALVRLDEPFADLTPFGLAPGLAVGDEVAILSYGRDRPEAPSIQAPCATLARHGAIAVLDCDVTFGVSGAPVFRLVDGQWRIVAIVSSMGEYKGAQRAFAVALDASLGAVLALP